MQRTIKDVAKLAGISPSTVSRVLNRSGYASPETQRKVEEAAAELGYHPNWLARGLKGKQSHLIGLIIPDISNTFYTTIAQAVSIELRAHNYELILCVNDESPQVDLHYLEILRHKRVDGILYIHPAEGSNRAYLEELVREGMPIVEMNRQQAGDLLDAALADNFRGALQMTEYLLKMGHRRIGLMIGAPDVTTGRGRLEGYRSAHQNAAVPVDPSLIRVGSFSRAYGEQATRELLRLPDPPTAIFAGSNRLLMGCLTVLAEHKLCVPDDISIGAFDDSEWLSIWHPPITAVDIATGEMARLAVDLLFRRIDDRGSEHRPVTYSLSATLVPRGSCQPPRPPAGRNGTGSAS